MIEMLKRVLEKALNPFTMKKPPEPPEGFRGKIIYEPEKCIGCGLCVRFCPSTTIKMKPDRKITLHLTECCYCGTCEEICPGKCIHLTEDYTQVSTDKKTKEWIIND